MDVLNLSVLNLIGGRWSEGEGEEFADTNQARPAEVVARGRFASARDVERLEAGVLHVNSESAGTFPYVPFGRTKQSGFGPKEQGRAAREFFTQTVTVYLGAPA